MMSRSSVSSSPPKKSYKGGHTNVAWQRSQNMPKARSGYHQPHHCSRQNHNYHRNMLLHRLSLPSSPTLLERIGGSVEDVDEAASTLTDSDRVDVDETDTGASATPGEVERFLESVIGATGMPPPPPSPSPSSPPPDRGHARLDNKPTLALETCNLPPGHPVTVEDPSSSVLYSPTQTAVNSLSPANLTLEHCPQSPFLGDTMSPPSASTLEECRKRLVPVLVAAAQARDPEKRLDAEECHTLLSDDHCTLLFRKAKEMRHQLASRKSQQTPLNQNQSWGGSSKHDRVDDVDAWVRSTRSRFSSANTVVSDVSNTRRDSDITLVDFSGGRLPPKAPRAMLQAYQRSSNKFLDAGRGEAPSEVLVASPTTDAHPASTLLLTDLVEQDLNMVPALAPTSQPGIVPDTSNVPVGMSVGGVVSAHPTPVVSPTPTISPSTTDFVSHLPTQAGIWFRQQGRRQAEIVDVDIDVSDDMFYMSTERRPFRLRMHLRLCSVPVSAEANNNGAPPGSFQDVHGIVDSQAVHWPQKGKLVIQVNPDSERSQTWLPYALETGPVDVTSCMQPGKNTFRFIQLSDLSEFTFILAASPPPPADEWRSWDWASVVARAPPRQSTTGEPRRMVHGLAEFAQIPVTIRS